METCESGKFRYSSDEAILDVSYSALDGMIHAYLFSTRETSFQTLHTPEGEVLCLNGVPIAAESYPALLQLVEAENSKATHPLLTLFPRMAHRGAASVQRRSLLQAARWYASALELHRERLSGEFGFVPAFLPAQVAQPSWGGRMSGLHLRDDARLYRLRAGLGNVDLVPYDAVTGDPIGPAIDVRAWAVIPSRDFGDIPIVRRPCDVNPVLRKVRDLEEFLSTSRQETVGIEWIEQELEEP